MATLSPKNWHEFQHYRDRKPAWIKLHRAILDDYDFHCLPVASRALAPCIWLLASEYQDGQIPADLPAIAFRVRMSVEELTQALKPLIDKGFIVDASNVLADCYQDASLEKEREREKETERETEYRPSDSSPTASKTQPDDRVPAQAVVDAYNEILGETFPRVAKLTNKRRTAVRKLWHSDTENPNFKRRTDNLAYWRRYFAHCLTIEFFTAEKTGDHQNWRPDFDFLMSERGYLGVLEGKYV